MTKSIKLYGSDLITLKEELKEAQEKHDFVNVLLSDLFERAGVIKPVNLKLHEIAYLSDPEDFGSYFSGFCEDEYNYFNSRLKEDGLKMRHVGRSSFFYIEARDVALWVDPLYYEWVNMDLEDFINNMAGVVDIPPALVDYNTFNEALSSGLAVDPLEAVLSELINEYDHFITSVYTDLSEQVEAINRAYTDIAYYKSIQMDHWGAHLEGLKEAI